MKKSVLFFALLLVCGVALFGHTDALAFIPFIGIGAISTLADCHGAVLADFLGTRVTSAAVTAVTAGAFNTLASTNAYQYSIQNKPYTKAAMTGAATPAAAAQAAGTTCYYLIEADSAGTLTAVKGVDGGGLPSRSSTAKCPLFIIKVATTTNPFTLGTTNWNAAGVTVAVQDIVNMPAKAADVGL